MRDKLFNFFGFFILLISFLLFFLFLSYDKIFAADSGTCIESPIWTWIKDWQNKEIGHVMTLKCTANNAGALSVTLSDSIMDKLSGQWIILFKSKPGSMPPTDGTDLEIIDSDGLSLLGTNGTNFIDRTSTLETIGYNSFLSLDKYIFAVGEEPWIISASNNSQAGAIFYLKIYLSPVRY